MRVDTARLSTGVVVCLLLTELLCFLGLLQWLATDMNPVSVPPPRRHHARLKPYTFPDGGKQIFPGYRAVALYGSADYPELGVLGAQDLAASISRVKDLAAQYRPLTTDHILPTFEMIATVAAGSPTENGDYSQEADTHKLAEWIKSARQAGIYVVLDLQPGRSDFLSQAKALEPLLQQPNVGLALDPEWRLGPTQLPLQQIGSVSIAEINGTVQWLAELTATHNLPQKLLVIHQFRLDSLPDRQLLDTSRTQLAYVIQMDGSGSQTQKLNTWRAITANPPSNVQFGWKNFYHQDQTLLDPTGTMAITPQPAYISYQ